MAIPRDFRTYPYDDSYLSQREIHRLREEYDRREYERQKEMNRLMNAVPPMAVKKALTELKELKVLVNASELSPYFQTSPCEFKNPNIILLCEI